MLCQTEFVYILIFIDFLHKVFLTNKYYWFLCKYTFLNIRDFFIRLIPFFLVGGVISCPLKFLQLMMKTTFF